MRWLDGNTDSMDMLLLLIASVTSGSVQPHRRQPTRLPRPWDSPGKNTGVGCHFLLQCVKVKSEREVPQSCPTLSNAMDCSLPGSAVHGIFQARVLEWCAIAFSIPRSKRLLISWLQSPSTVILEPKKIKSVTVSIVSPSVCHEMLGPDAIILVFECCFKSAFSIPSFTSIKRLFSSSLLSAIRVLLSAYLILLIFLLTILIPACALSSLEFHMMYSAYKLNKQCDNIQP